MTEFSAAQRPVPATQQLAGVPLLATLPPSELEALAARLRELTFAPGTHLVREGERGDQFYLILEGQLEVVKAEGSPDERLVGVRGPGEYIGEMSLFNPDSERTASVRARQATRVLEMTRADLDQLLQRQPQLAYTMVRVLSQRLTDAHNQTIHSLQVKNRELTEAYTALQAAQAQLIEKERLERELQVAAAIQLSILPRTLPQLAGVDLGAHMTPARAVGGDFYDALPLDAERLGLVIGDVTDKGVPAAIFMARTHAFWRAEAARGGSPRAVLERVNAHLLETNAEGLFVTVLYGLLNCRTGAFTYARAGHDTPRLVAPDGTPLELPFAVGEPLGILPAPALDEQTVQLPAGGLLLLYTDGVTEAWDAQSRPFGEGRLDAVLRDQAPAPAQAVCERVRQAVAAYRGPAPQADDVTLLAARATR
ncbi:MAG: SpoIIE family protein phosphatase [Anaerolineales bacterium]|nr:SpoIIE family protein phosphatase [Anaerolineales bacterium]